MTPLDMYEMVFAARSNSEDVSCGNLDYRVQEALTRASGLQVGLLVLYHHSIATTTRRSVLMRFGRHLPHGV